MSNPDTNRTIPDSTIIFVTDTTNSIEIQQAVNLYNSALKGIVKITFILAGNKTDAVALQGFDDAKIFYWQNMNTSQPDNWDTSQALRCTPLTSTTIGSSVSTSSTQSPATSVSTQGSTSTVMSSTSPTTLTSVPSTGIPSSTTPSSYIPCQSWISFGVDDTSGLNSNDFATQLNFISNTIGSLNHPERIQAIGAFDHPVVWNSPFSISQIQQYVTAMQQAGSYLLRNQFAALLNSLQNIQPTETPIGALIFISDTSDQALQGASDIFGQIQNVRITFVLHGNNVDQSKLTQFTNYFIFWTDLSKPQPDNWNSTIAFPAYGCPAYLSVSSQILHSQINKYLQNSKLSIDDYCISTPTSSSITTNSMNFISSTPNPNEITPPLPVINCSDPDNSYIIKQTCLINDTSNPVTLDQLINTTSTHIQEKINNDNFTAENAHDTGIFIFTTVSTVDNLNTDSAHNFLDITNSVVNQSLDILTAANNITPNSLLWYPSSLPKVIAKTEQDLNYSKPDSNILVHSFSLNSSFCGDNKKSSHQICYSSSSQVLPESNDAEFCTTFIPKILCNNANKAFLIMWKSLSFFALVKNNSMNIKNGLENMPPQPPDQVTTYDNANKCSQGTYYKNNYGSNVGGVYSNGESISTGSQIWIKRRDNENDLHISKYKMAKFVATSFEDSGSKVTKESNHYAAYCPDGTCTLVLDGNPNEPIICSSGAKTTTALVTGIGIFLAVVGVCAVLVQSDAVPIVGRVLKIFFSIFGDKNLPMRLKFFASCYNITFMLYSAYSIFISQQTLTDTNENMCTIFAIVGYVLYISAVFLSVIMLVITLDALGCWKSSLKYLFYIFTGNKRNYIPFIHSYGIPLIITAVFAATLTSFFKRNDGYCWIRPDYAILALWFPLILLLLTIPLYIILFSRRWSNFGLSKFIYIPLTIPDELSSYEEEKTRREEQEKQEKLKEFTEKLFGKSKNEGNDEEEESNNTKEEKVILTNETLARLLIPQIFLAIPLIAENLALYYSQLTGWHYLFMLTQALQLIVLNAIDWLEELPEKLEFVRAAFDAIKGKPKKQKSDESKWGTNQ